MKVALSAIGEALRRTFLHECHGFLLKFLEVWSSSESAEYERASSWSRFGPEMMLQGTEAHTQTVFNNMTTYSLE